MALDLPEPSTEKLERSPLSLVVCQVRHEHTLAASDPKRAVAIHEVIKADYPSLDEQSSQEMNISAGALGVQTLPGQVSRGWRMRSQDQALTAVVMPEFFSLETTRYGDWKEFRGRLETLTTAVAQSIGPSLEQRIGLRFIDRITHPDVTGAKDWERWIHPSFLGPIAHEVLGRSVDTTQQIVQLDAEDGRSVILRHGCSRDPGPAGEWVYMLDNDCFIQRGQSFDVDRIMSEVDQLHRLALQIFQAAITQDLYEYLKGDR